MQQVCERSREVVVNNVSPGNQAAKVGECLKRDAARCNLDVHFRSVDSTAFEADDSLSGFEW